MTINKQKTTEAVNFEQVDIKSTPTFTETQCVWNPPSCSFFPPWAKERIHPVTKEVLGVQGEIWTKTVSVIEEVYIFDAELVFADAIEDGKAVKKLSIIRVHVTDKASLAELKETPNDYVSFDLAVKNFPSLEDDFAANKKAADSDHPLRVAIRANIALFKAGKGVLVNLHRFLPNRGGAGSGNWFGKITLANGSVDTPADQLGWEI